MIYPTTITEKSQMTIPKEVMKELNLKRGERIFVEAEKEERAIKIQSYPSIFELAGKFKPKKVENAVKLRKKMARNYQER